MGRSSPFNVFRTLLVCSIIVHGARHAQCYEHYCYSSDTERTQTTHFGSKTSYRSVIAARLNATNCLVPSHAACSPTKLWLYVRHGTRLSNNREKNELSALGVLRDKILANYDKSLVPNADAICNDDLRLLRNWEWNRNSSINALTAEGWEELKMLATRLQHCLPQLMPSVYDRAGFHFQHSPTQRAEASFRAFAEGLFGKGAHEHINLPPPSTDHDALLWVLRTCGPFDYSDAGAEHRKFLGSPVMRQLVQDVSTRLGFNDSLQTRQVIAMLDMCRFDQAWNVDKPSPWCVVFRPQQFDVFEYLEDLSKYYKFGYGRDTNVNLSCSAMQDLVHRFNSNDGPKIAAYFTHSSSLTLVLNALGIARDADTLRADNYHHMDKRQFRMTALTPFGANFMAIKYSCPNEPATEKVAFLLNEKPVHLEWCGGSRLCDLQAIRDRLEGYMQGTCADFYCANPP